MKLIIWAQHASVSVLFLQRFVSARKIKKTQPINGLRGISNSKQSNKNHFPLDSTNGNTYFLLVIKQIFACKKQNVLLFLVSFVLTVLIAFSSTLFYNVAIEPENFMSALSEEAPDVIIKPEEQHTLELYNILKSEKLVKNALQYTTGNVKIEDRTITAFVCEDFSQVENNICYKGRNPERADEIALGSVFEDKYKIGDTIEVSLNNEIKILNVTGFVQSVNLQGELCELSLETYISFSENIETPSIYVYLEDTADVGTFIENCKNTYPFMISDVQNSQKLQKEAQDMYMGITLVLTALIFAITIMIVLFILYIVIKSLLVKRRQEFGIYKSMGYTSSQLIWQTTGSFIPMSALAILLSTISAVFYMPYIYQFIFEALGVMKNNIEISFGFLMLFAVAQIFAYIIISIILCMPIKKISAYSLIKE